MDTEHLLDAIWQQELKLSQCNGNTGRHLRFDPADPVLIARPPKTEPFIANMSLDEDQVDFVVTMMTAEETAVIERVTVQNEPAAGNHDENKLSSQSNNAFTKVELQEKQEPEHHESTSEAIGNAPRHEESPEVIHFDSNITEDEVMVTQEISEAESIASEEEESVNNRERAEAVEAEESTVNEAGEQDDHQSDEEDHDARDKHET